MLVCIYCFFVGAAATTLPAPDVVESHSPLWNLPVSIGQGLRAAARIFKPALPGVVATWSFVEGGSGDTDALYDRMERGQGVAGYIALASGGTSLHLDYRMRQLKPQFQWNCSGLLPAALNDLAARELIDITSVRVVTAEHAEDLDLCRCYARLMFAIGCNTINGHYIRTQDDLDPVCPTESGMLGGIFTGVDPHLPEVDRKTLHSLRDAQFRGRVLSP